MIKYTIGWEWHDRIKVKKPNDGFAPKNQHEYQDKPACGHIKTDNVDQEYINQHQRNRPPVSRNGGTRYDETHIDEYRLPFSGRPVMPLWNKKTDTGDQHRPGSGTLGNSAGKGTLDMIRDGIESTEMPQNCQYDRIPVSDRRSSKSLLKDNRLHVPSTG